MTSSNASIFEHAKLRRFCPRRRSAEHCIYLGKLSSGIYTLVGRLVGWSAVEGEIWEAVVLSKKLQSLWFAAYELYVQTHLPVIFCVNSTIFLLYFVRNRCIQLLCQKVVVYSDKIMGVHFVTLYTTWDAICFFLTYTSKCTRFSPRSTEPICLISWLAGWLWNYIEMEERNLK